MLTEAIKRIENINNNIMYKKKEKKTAVKPKQKKDKKETNDKTKRIFKIRNRCLLCVRLWHM